MDRPQLTTRAKTVLCRCRSYCTVLNHETGRYEGEGNRISRSLRDRHARSDKQRSVIGASSSSIPPSSVIHTQLPNNHSNFIMRSSLELANILSFPVINIDQPLQFCHDPRGSGHGDFVLPSDEELMAANQGLYSLTVAHSNRAFLRAERQLVRLISSAMELVGSVDAAAHILQLRNELRNLTLLKGAEWSSQRSEGSERPFVNTVAYFQPFAIRKKENRAAIILTLVMQSIHFTSRRGLRSLLAGIKSFSEAAGISPVSTESIPTDPRPLSRHFCLNPITRQYIACPSCHCLYPYRKGDTPLKEINPFILRCTHKRTPTSSVCDTLLWTLTTHVDGITKASPIRKYVHQDLKSWIGRLLARKGMEELLDRPLHNNFADSSSPVDDIWRSLVFRNLKDVQGNPFISRSDNDGRLVFSLSVDSFNPFHNKTAKQSVSSTGIWLVLLNLPQHLRYLQENMYLAGVIPGPNKPSKEDLYPYLDLVIDDLEVFYYHGVEFARTYQRMQARIFWALLVPLICDMLAARQVSGLGASTSHYFCSFCSIDIDDIDILDKREWPRKDEHHMRAIGQLWKDAESEDRQQQIFERYGLRWSPLLRLPYWNPVLYTIIDPMHALDLNLLQNHCRSVFQIDIEREGGDGISDAIPSSSSRRRSSINPNYRARHRRCCELIRQGGDGILEEMISFPRQILFKICVDNRILGQGHTLVIGTRWILANNIVAWRASKPDNEDVEVLEDSATRDDLEDQLEHELEPGPIDEPEQTAQNTELPQNENLNMTLVTRVIRHIVDTDNPTASRQRAYEQGSAAIFAYVCAILEIDHEIDERRRAAKGMLFNLIIEAIDEDIEKLLYLQAITNESGTTLRRRPVLGKDVMECVWRDMKSTQLPTWITPAPSNWGTTQRGKLSADNWRVICTIHLPFTLIALWGQGSNRKQEMLRHFMDLVSAVRIANMRVTSTSQIERYDAFMNRYISNLRILYPDQQLKPTHHAACHIGEMLGLFGPNHSHSGPHYERYINFFHRIKTNSKIGQLESTLFHAASRSANLRALISDNDEIRDNVFRLIQVMDQVDLEDARGFRLASILDPQSPLFAPRSRTYPSRLDHFVHQQVCDLLDRSMELDSMPKQAEFMTEISLHGVCYGTSTAPGAMSRNSSIVYKHRVSPGNDIYEIRPAKIEDIFHYQYNRIDGSKAEEIFLKVKSLEFFDIQTDPYRQYGEFAGFLCYLDRFQITAIPLSRVISHCAATKISGGLYDGLLHMLPVDRLMFEFASMPADDVQDLDPDPEGLPEVIVRHAQEISSDSDPE